MPTKLENKYFYDDNSTRYQLVKSNPGTTIFNWLFLPGGPGIDTNYLLGLIKDLDVAGNYWLIDLPNSGTNISNKLADSIFENWGAYLLSTVKKFENPILVGHSFGGYFPLFFPQLERILKGFVILNSVPTLNSNEFEKCITENKLPSRLEFIDTFKSNPSENSARAVYLAGATYCFPAASLENGTLLLEKLSFSYRAVYWWHTVGSTIYSTIKWIPEMVPTLILGATHDFLTPIKIFKQDNRFHRDNIKIINIPDAGHFPWIEQMPTVKRVFREFFEPPIQ